MVVDVAEGLVEALGNGPGVQGGGAVELALAVVSVDAGKGALVGEPDRLGRVHALELLYVEVRVGKLLRQLCSSPTTSAISSCTLASYSASFIIIYMLLFIFYYKTRREGGGNDDEIRVSLINFRKWRLAFSCGHSDASSCAPAPRTSSP